MLVVHADPTTMIDPSSSTDTASPLFPMSPFAEADGSEDLTPRHTGPGSC